MKMDRPHAPPHPRFDFQGNDVSRTISVFVAAPDVGGLVSRRKGNLQTPFV